jgi:hypothetical protein
MCFYCASYERTPAARGRLCNMQLIEGKNVNIRQITQCIIFDFLPLELRTKPFRSEIQRTVVSGMHPKGGGGVLFAVEQVMNRKINLNLCTARTSSLSASVIFQCSLMTKECASSRRRRSRQ